MKESIAMTMEERMLFGFWLAESYQELGNWRKQFSFDIIYLVAGSCKKVRDNARIIKSRFPSIVRCMQYL